MLQHLQSVSDLLSEQVHVSLHVNDPLQARPDGREGDVPRHEERGPRLVSRLQGAEPDARHEVQRHMVRFGQVGLLCSTAASNLIQVNFTKRGTLLDVTGLHYLNQ